MDGDNNRAVTDSDTGNDKRGLSNQAVRTTAYMQTNIKYIRNSKIEQNGSNSAACNFPVIVTTEMEGEEVKLPPLLSEDSLNKFRTLPPIPSEINHKQPISFVVPNEADLCHVRFRLPPISTQLSEEKPYAKNEYVKYAVVRDSTPMNIFLEEKQRKEKRKRQRLKEYAKRRAENIEAWEAAKTLKIENYLYKLDLVERNKEQIRQQKRRKLQNQEEKRRKAREKLSKQRKQWIASSKEKNCD